MDEQNTTEYREYLDESTEVNDLEPWCEPIPILSMNYLEPRYKRVLAMSEQLFGSNPNELLVCSLNHLAEFYESHERWAKMEPLLDRVLAIREELYGDRPNGLLVESLNRLAEFYGSQERWTEAEPLFDRVLAICEELSGDRPDEWLMYCLDNLTKLYESQERWTEAEPLLERALAIHEGLFGDLLPDDDLFVRLNNLPSRRLSYAHGLTHIYDPELGAVIPISCLLKAAPYTIESIDGHTCLRVTLNYLWHCDEYRHDYQGYATAQDILDTTITGKFELADDFSTEIFPEG